LANLGRCRGEWCNTSDHGRSETLRTVLRTSDSRSMDRQARRIPSRLRLGLTPSQGLSAVADGFRQPDQYPQSSWASGARLSSSRYRRHWGMNRSMSSRKRSLWRRSRRWTISWTRMYSRRGASWPAPGSARSAGPPRCNSPSGSSSCGCASRRRPLRGDYRQSPPAFLPGFLPTYLPTFGGIHLTGPSLRLRHAPPLSRVPLAAVDRLAWFQTAQPADRVRPRAMRPVPVRA
jgi:hypothetical protein